MKSEDHSTEHVICPAEPVKRVGVIGIDHGEERLASFMGVWLP